MSLKVITKDINELTSICKTVRSDVLKMFKQTGHGHFGGCYSCTEILTSLYYGGILNLDVDNPKNPDRDRFVLSKGHGAPALYSVLCQYGYFPYSYIDGYELLGANLSTHPNMHRVPGLDFSAGSLGHGMSIAVGMSLAAKGDEKDYYTYVLIGDGETNEGSNWEAAMSASAWKLDNLIAITDRNRLCVAGPTEEIMPIEPLYDKWAAFGFETVVADGHNMKEFIDTISTLKNSKNGKPKMIIANTIKGKGVSFMEDERTWHGHPINDEQFAQAMAELTGGAK